MAKKKMDEKDVQKVLEVAGISGKDFADLSDEEMAQLAGAEGGDVDPEVTPTVVIGTITSAIGSAVVSYVASAEAKC
ncbi:lichenicidin A2 family type 2 lantibiotic [Petralouisia muris]|uniref:lichenicidin A2 family type 2 lantibiotic n=1 Tax=Petralouisia muris TaxID=3032872 RepID=UPI001441E139|nr:lichenicidin A2 family type 2 lantibiotic [Petralouisia muris]